MTTNLGTFQRTDAGFTGSLETLAFLAEIEIRAVPAEGDRAPDHRIYSVTGREIGAGWTRRSKRGGEFLSLKIADPALGSLPIYPALVESERAKGTWNLLLNGRETA